LLIAAGIASVLLFATIRSGYPRRAVPALLFASHVLGLAFVESIKTGQIYAWYALPYGVAAIVALLLPLGTASGWRRAVVAVSLGGLALFNTGLIRHDLRRHRSTCSIRASSQASVSGAFRARHHGEAAYWYVVPRGRFQTNSNIWLNRYEYGWDFARSFHHLCADLVILDDVWLSHYAAKTPFPQVAPSDPAEKEQLLATLAREYTLEKSLTSKGHAVQLWRKRGGAAQASRVRRHGARASVGCAGPSMTGDTSPPTDGSPAARWPQSYANAFASRGCRTGCSAPFSGVFTSTRRPRRIGSRWGCG